jgi:hypothetical protein
MTKIPWPLVGLALLGLAAVIAVDRWSTREDRWKATLAQTVAAVQVADSVDAAALRDQLARDSAATAALRAHGDTAKARANAEERHHVVLAQELSAARTALDSATTLGDSVVRQAAVIARQDRVIASDSAQTIALRQTIADRETELADTSTVHDLRVALSGARSRLAELVAVAGKPPKELKLLGLHLSLKPYLGAGLNISPQGKAAVGLQLGESLLRG